MILVSQALPKSVIKNGSVIEIRSNVSAMIHGVTTEERPDVVVVNTEGELHVACEVGSSVMILA